MPESIGADIGTRILQAVEGLGLRMDRLEARMGKLEARMDGLEARMDKVESELKDLGGRMDKVETQVTDLISRMGRQEKLVEMLGAEFLKSRDELRGDIQQLRGEVQQVRTDMNEGFRRLNARIDLTDSVVILLAEELRRPREFRKPLETNLRQLDAR